jgi:histone acetyltransferase (RNA polymerase elongator complex component)
MAKGGDVKESPLVIPVFISQEGCPHRCLYCDQRSITGVTRPDWSPAALRRYAEVFLAANRRPSVEMAFYGGSFTLLPEARQALYLEAVQSLLHEGRVHSLRLSTRPDAVTERNLQFLRPLGVRTVELGAQSLSDRVLAASTRGHSSEDIRGATARLRRHGLRVGLQLMPGLPADDRATFLQTVAESIALRPDFVRVYPTLVLAGTPLAGLYRRGAYRPLSVAEAVDWCKEAALNFTRAGIPIIRMGLQTSAALERPGVIVAGPYHPAFGQLVKSAIWYDRISAALAEMRSLSSRPTIHLHPSDLADARGHRNGNIAHWLGKFSFTSLRTVADPELPRGKFRLAPR